MVIPRSLREEAGVSEGTIMKVAVVKGGKFLITPQRATQENNKQSFRELAEVVNEIRQEAKAKGLDTMPMKEIDRAVAAARRDLRKANKRSAQ